MRLFAALPLSAEVIAKLLTLQLRLSHPQDGLRWSTPEQWHLTLHFFGELAPSQVACLTAAVETLDTVSPRLTLDSLELFSAKGILVASIGKNPLLSALHQALAAAAERCGLQLDSRPFHPHITLARARGKAGHRTLHNLSQPTLPSLGDGLAWCPPQLQLLESILRPQGAEYGLHHAIPLRQLQISPRR